MPTRSPRRNERSKSRAGRTFYGTSGGGGGGGGFDPATLSGNVLWLRAKDLGSSGSVTSWTDQSGNSNSPTSFSNTTVVTGVTPSSGKVARLANATIALPDLGMVYGTVLATASSTYDSGYVAWQMNDGSLSTGWIAGNGTTPPYWVKYKIVAGAATVTSYTLTAFSGEAHNMPSAWTFEGSNDNSAWTTLDTRSGISFSGQTPQTFNFSNSTAYLYYRLSISATTSGGMARIVEFTLGGISTATATAGPGEMWMVIKSNDTGGAAWLLGTSGSSSHYTFGGTVYDDFGATVRDSFTPSVSVSSAFRLLRIAITSGGTKTWHIDNVQQSSQAGRTKGWNASPKLANGWAGDIAEVLVRSQVSTSGEIASLIAYFNTEHGLTVT